MSFASYVGQLIASGKETVADQVPANLADTPHWFAHAAFVNVDCMILKFVSFV